MPEGASSSLVPPDPAQTPIPDELPAEPFGAWHQSLRDLKDAAGSSIAELSAARSDLAAALTSLRRAVAWDPDRADEEIASLTAALEGAERRVAGRIAALEEGVDRAVSVAAASLRGLGEVYRRLRTQAPPAPPADDRMAGWPARLPGVEELREEIGEVLGRVRGDIEELRLDMKQAAGPTHEVLTAVHDSVTELRGAFHEGLSASQEEQRAARQAVGDRLATLEQALSDELERLGSRVDRRLKATAERPSAGEREVAAAQEVLRAEIEAFRKQIEGWGKPRTAPRLAEEVRALEGRLEELERSVESTIAREVARRVQASVERRLRRLLDDLPERIRTAVLEATAGHGEGADLPDDRPEHPAAWDESGESASPDGPDQPALEALRQPAVVPPEERSRPIWAAGRRSRFRRRPR